MTMTDLSMGYWNPERKLRVAAPMIRAETSNERPRLFNRESKCKTNTLAKRTGNQGNNRDMRTMV